MAEARRYTFPKSHRIRTATEFSAVFEDRVRESRGPLMLYGRPNGLSHPRLGLSVGRKVGTAPRRNRIKRLIREAFRLHQYDLPVGYDLVFVVRPHTPMILAEYQKIFTSLLLKIHQLWQKRSSPSSDQLANPG
jgi:ribonuclease P protein component